jgi:hypothetical protein
MEGEIDLADQGKCNIHDLRRCILRLRDEIMVKPEDTRTQLDGALVEMSLAFADALLRYERSSEVKTGAEASVTNLLKGYNAINHERARRDLDVEALAIFRQPIGREG